MRYSESIRPISYLKAHTSEIVRDVAEGGTSYVITQHGEATAVVQSVQEYEKMQETFALLKILALSEQEIAADRIMPATEVFDEAEKLINEY